MGNSASVSARLSGGHLDAACARGGILKAKEILLCEACVL